MGAAAGLGALRHAGDRRPSSVPLDTVHFPARGRREVRRGSDHNQLIREALAVSKGTFVTLGWLPKPPENFASLCKNVHEMAEGAGLELQALATSALDQNQLVRLAKTINHLRASGTVMKPLAPFRLGIVSNATTDFIVPALVATAARHGIVLEVVAGEYDQVLQETLEANSKVNRAAPDAVLLAIDYRGFPLSGIAGQPEKGKAAVATALDYLQSVRNGIKRHSQAVCILQTLSAPPETLFGSLDAVHASSLHRMIDGVNAGIVDSLEGSTDVLIDVAHLAATVGLSDWHSPREWNMARVPFSDAFVPLYAEHVCRVIAALRGKSRRCLILDLDNTLWGGVVGDDGLEGIRCAQGDATGEAYLSVQRLALELRSRGIVLAICSKNEDEIARAPFRNHPDMLIREDHIAVFQANWTDKATNIRAIAEELSLGLESMVFLDDNPVERHQVRRELPQVAVPELPSDPALYSRTLAAAGYFEALTVSDEDLRRADFYQNNARRANLQKTAGDLGSYLASLEMEITLQPFDGLGRARVTQLINKSNQFNLTTKRYTEAQIAEMERDPSYFTLQVRLTDVFGDNGMISVVICRRLSTEEWEIDTWIMSCRVMGRCVENMVLGTVLEQATNEGVRKLIGVYIPTDRNKMVSDHYPKLGFKRTKTEGFVETYELDVEGAVVANAPMKVRRIDRSEVLTSIKRAHPATPGVKELASNESPTHRVATRSVEPRNNIEAELVSVWEEILDCDGVGVRDNFFDLGGDSLRAIRLMIELERLYQRQFDLSVLTSCGTIEALARELERDAKEDQTPHLVPMRTTGTRTPLFCVHCGTGNVLRYRALTSFLDPEIPIYGLRAPDLRDSGALPTVEGLAELYLADVRQVQPHGPYQFFGFCFGGSVAFEISRRLVEQGEPVSLVALAETVNTAHYRNLSLSKSLSYGALRQYERLRKYGRWLLQGNWKEIYGGVRDSITWNRRRLQWTTPASDRPTNKSSGIEAVEDTIALLSVVGDSFCPKPYAGKMHLLRAKGQVAALRSDMTFGWQSIPQHGLEVHTLPGDHLTLLEKPYVSNVADTLEKLLDKNASRV